MLMPSRTPDQARTPSATSATTVSNVFSVDVEDYFQVAAFEKHVCRDSWGQWESRVVANTGKLLAILDRHGVRATFFVLGWVGDRFPGLVRDIRAGGHEIGSHGYWHRLVFSQQPEEFREDLRRSRDVLEAAAERPVTCYRAPKFSIDRRAPWALDILAEEGFLVDASIRPRDYLGFPIRDINPKICRLATSGGPIWEFPVSLARLAGLMFPIGGGYFRLCPWSWMAASLSQIERRGEPFMFYIHPWEVDPGQPRISAASQLTRFRHYVNLAATERKLERLLSQFRFAPLCDAIRNVASQSAGPGRKQYFNG